MRGSTSLPDSESSALVIIIKTLIGVCNLFDFQQKHKCFKQIDILEAIN